MKISVLISVYDKESRQFFIECLDSLVNQSVKADEVVIVEDGILSESLLEVIEKYRNILNIVSCKLYENVGLAKALNSGLNICSGELIIRMDADDICYSDRIMKQSNFMTSNPDVDVLGTQAVEINFNGVQGRLRKVPVLHADIIESIWANPFLHPSVAFRKSKIVGLGGYNELCIRRQDYELWFRCAKNKLFFSNLNEPLIYYRFDKDSHTKQSIKLAFNQGAIGYRGCRSLGMPLWKGLVCFMPFFRSLLPLFLQHVFYHVLTKFDPRTK
jgi:glycosyltransferase involved in cell wall biosynthesis